MHERSRLALLALNVALLLALGVVLWAPRATAQSRPRGDYLMVSGEVNGASGQVLNQSCRVRQKPWGRICERDLSLAGGL